MSVFTKSDYEEFEKRYSLQQLIASMDSRMRKLTKGIDDATNIDNSMNIHAGELKTATIYQYLKTNIMIFDVMAYHFSNHIDVHKKAMQFFDLIFTSSKSAILDQFELIEDETVSKNDKEAYTAINRLREVNWIDMLKKYGFCYDENEYRGPYNDAIFYCTSGKYQNFIFDETAVDFPNNTFSKEDREAFITILNNIAILARCAPEKTRKRLIAPFVNRADKLDAYMHSFDDAPDTIAFDGNGVHQAFEIWLNDQVDINTFIHTRDRFMDDKH